MGHGVDAARFLRDVVAQFGVDRLGMFWQILVELDRHVVAMLGDSSPSSWLLKWGAGRVPSMSRVGYSWMISLSVIPVARKSNTMLTMIRVPRTVAWALQIDGSLTILFRCRSSSADCRSTPQSAGGGVPLLGGSRSLSTRRTRSATKIEYATCEDAEWSFRAWRRDFGRPWCAGCVEGMTISVAADLGPLRSQS